MVTLRCSVSQHCAVRFVYTGCLVRCAGGHVHHIIHDCDLQMLQYWWNLMLE